ncbi:hypothetical protein [Allobranchiibius huperziae]|uniref:Uncharacterized protein n=1 Tax=Allobranchiibius huperziae TaxID=1874116 RepID=A0A853DBE8_9MICO|nr:hypothetical protein [Allobranchiibius huperziae]NYJ74886.1 hypothetical protein [Allobranchiibius huperziae]
MSDPTDKTTPSDDDEKVENLEAPAERRRVSPDATCEPTCVGESCKKTVIR